MSLHFTNALGLTLLIFIAVGLWVILTHWQGYLFFGVLCIVGAHLYQERKAKKRKRAMIEDDNVTHLTRPTEPV